MYKELLNKIYSGASKSGKRNLPPWAWFNFQQSLDFRYFYLKMQRVLRASELLMEFVLKVFSLNQEQFHTNAGKSNKEINRFFKILMTETYTSKTTGK